MRVRPGTAVPELGGQRAQPRQAVRAAHPVPERHRQQAGHDHLDAGQTGRAVLVGGLVDDDHVQAVLGEPLDRVREVVAEIAEPGTAVGPRERLRQRDRFLPQQEGEPVERARVAVEQRVVAHLAHLLRIVDHPGDPLTLGQVGVPVPAEVRGQLQQSVEDSLFGVEVRTRRADRGGLVGRGVHRHDPRGGDTVLPGVAKASTS